MPEGYSTKGIFGDVAAGVGLGAGIFSIFTQKRAAKTQESMLDLQATQEEIGARQQGLARAKQIRQVMADQTVQAAGGGMESGSGSFQAIQRSSFDAFQQDNMIGALNLATNRAKVEAQRQQIRDRAASGIFDTVAKMATSAFKGAVTGGFF